MPVVDVAVPVPLKQSFSYRHHTPVQIGVRVQVPFGNRTLIGVVLNCAEDDANNAELALKSVTDVLDDVPLFDATLITLVNWLAKYYHHPIGEVWATLMPVRLRKGMPLTDKLDAFAITESGQDALEQSLVKGKKQQQCLAMFAEGPVEEGEIKQLFTPAVVKALLEKALIHPVQITQQSQPDWASYSLQETPPFASREQAVAIAAINQAGVGFRTFLIEGVTGSGKTEVYLQVIAPVLKANRQVLILVPEIGLTPQTVGRFERRFGVKVGVLHSQMSDLARLQVWQQSRRGELGIVIGTRSAIFTPMARPGMIIVDEEHDESFKQQDGLRYHARDLAVKRAQTEKVPLLLGSATPSLESLNNALAGRYIHLQLSERAGGASHTQLKVLDSRDQPLQAGIAAGLLGIMRSHLQQGNQVLVFLNRRGYAPAVLCHHCGQTVDCKSCDRPYTFHKSQARLQCHHCGASKRMPTQCGACHSTSLQTSGVGTEQLEQGLGELFPDVKQVRIDSDAVRGKGALVARLDEINARKYQLLVGTQILSKGHHFPHVTLVVVLDCDGALFSADFRAPEKFAQLITQLAGRAGRATKPGEMVIQTDNPGHPLLQDLIQNGFAHFARHALHERKMANLPPYSAQAVIRAEANTAQQVHTFLQQVKQVFAVSSNQFGGYLAGPLPCLIEKRQGRFRFMVLLQCTQRVALHAWITSALRDVQGLPLANRVRWSLDIDPVDFS
ncbi:primosomal protein N' [Aestuariibacter sp. GS-14]|uniref:primosomal protein N' n=1 Tax=Aestuariibacter sp. GS-14 TaxID=2590670 RepID=UPI0011277869|nr:primosomal protein N' [Aestuariibacter sp. GS-14]TPV57942.1 primosomal protein N' [Aestuariibacter sp. GS-14]